MRIPSKSTILLTGPFGHVGQFVLRELLLRRRSVAIIARSKGRTTVEQRLTALLDRWKTEWDRPFETPQVLNWDLRGGPDGIPASSLTWLQENVGSIIHCAASVQFVEDEAGEPWVSNVEGTKNLLKLAQVLTEIDFHHVSTAFVCGKQIGTVHEASLDVGQEFQNVYEQSKIASEKLLNESRSTLRSLTIYRPSIVLGDSKTGFSPTFNTLYAGLRFARAIDFKAVPLVSELLSKLGLTGEELKNVVPVDWLASTIATAVESPSTFGRTYHLTHPNPVSLHDIVSAMTVAIELEPDAWKRLGETMPRIQDVSSAADSMMKPFRNYFCSDPIFDRTNTERYFPKSTIPPMDVPCLTRLFRFAIQRQFREQSFDPKIRRQKLGNGELRLLGPELGTGTELGMKEQSTFGTKDMLLPFVQMHQQTLNALIAGELDLTDSLRSGLVMVVGSQDETTNLLDELRDRLELETEPASPRVRKPSLRNVARFQKGAS